MAGFSRMSLQSIQCPPPLRAIVRAAAFASVFVAAGASAATLQIRLTDSHNRDAAGLGVVVETSTVEPRPATPPTAVIDQRHEQFVPRVSIVRRGTEVAFPNTDRVQHHVYSFS